MKVKYAVHFIVTNITINNPVQSSEDTKQRYLTSRRTPHQAIFTSGYPKHTLCIYNIICINSSQHSL